MLRETFIQHMASSMIKSIRKSNLQMPPRIIRGFKATQAINSEMFSNTYSRIDAGLVDFLIKEQEARLKLLATKRGQKMSVEQKTKFLMPYEMTSKLFEEMGNLRLRRSGTGLQISSNLSILIPRRPFFQSLY